MTRNRDSVAVRLQSDEESRVARVAVEPLHDLWSVDELLQFSHAELRCSSSLSPRHSLGSRLPRSLSLLILVLVIRIVDMTLIRAVLDLHQTVLPGLDEVLEHLLELGELGRPGCRLGGV